MTRIAFSGDQHTEAFHLTTLDEQSTALMFMVEESIRRGCRAIVLLGDATHGRRPGPAGLAVWGRVFARASAAGLRVVAIAGNHEGDGVTSLLSYFRGSITAFSEPGMVRDLYGIDLACLPWLPDRNVRAAAGGSLSREETAHRLSAAAAAILRGFVAMKRPGYPLVLATHATIAGASTSAGFDMGYRPDVDYVIWPDDLAGFDFVAAGHIHKRQAIDHDPAAHPRIVYTGSLLPLDFSETEPKGFTVATFEGSVMAPAVDFVPVPAPIVSTIDVPGDIATPAAVIDAAPAATVAGMKLRVRMAVDEATAREYPPARIRAAIMAAGASMVQVELTVTRPDRPMRVGEGRTPSGVLGDYLATRTDLDDATRIRIDNLATSVLREAAAAHPVMGDIEIVAIDAVDFLGVAHGSITFDGDGVYALTGPVGAGKSTVGVDAPRYALFGESRVGGKMADRLIRTGADSATVAITLRDGAGAMYLIVRKTRRTGRGPVTTLDVMMRDNPDAFIDPMRKQWRAMSTGKIADGEAHVARIIGGLDDETIGIANLVVQRRADSFVRARPEDRKRLLAQAAGLHVYEDLAVASMGAGRAATAALQNLHHRADPLRTRAAAIPAAAADVDRAVAAVVTWSGSATRAAAAVSVARTAFEGALERATAYQADREALIAVNRDIEGVDIEAVGWSRRRAAADAVIATRPEFDRARVELTDVRAAIVNLEAVVVQRGEYTARRNDAIAAHAGMTANLAAMRGRRTIDARDLDRQLESAGRRTDLLAQAQCCAPEVSCVLLADARAARDTIPDLEARLAAASEPTADESALIDRIARFTIPDPVDVAVTTRELADARRRGGELERTVALADGIARAETIVAEHDAAMRTIAARIADLAARKMTLDARVADYGDNPVRVAEDARREWDATVAVERAARAEEQTARETAATLRGRLEALREAAVELTAVDSEITTAAMTVAGWAELVTAWRACRVMVMEGSVIPGVEDVANDILRRFPYGLQIALRTQRDRRSSDGVVETLDVEVLGGRGALYELCSGGERTTIDTALHIAIALVVARRSTTRLRFMVIDEPEGLDEPGRMAFAAVIRSLHTEYGLTVLAMSHMPDLVDALGGRRIVATPGADGSTVAAV